MHEMRELVKSWPFGGPAEASPPDSGQSYRMIP